MEIQIIVAVSKNGFIGNAGEIPWHLPDDLKRFKALTTGHAIIMGRKTWESIGRPLPGRLNVVLSRQTDFSLPDGVRLANDLVAAIAICEEARQEKTFIIGGEAVYARALKIATHLRLTKVEQTVAGDARFPEWDEAAWVEYAREKHAGFTYLDYERRG